MSRRWERQLPQTPLGEVQDSFRLCRDYPPPGVLDSVGRCGSAAQWRFGALSTDIPPPIDPETGLPACCGSRVNVGQGGEVEGSAADFPFPGCGFPIPPVIYGIVETGPIVAEHLRAVLTYALVGSQYVVVSVFGYISGVDLTTFSINTVSDPNLWTVNGLRGVPTPWVVGALCTPTILGFTDSNTIVAPNTLFLTITRTWPYYTSSAQGGEAEGGFGWNIPDNIRSAQGGEAEGGTATSSRMPHARGGEAEGGIGTDNLNHAASGGEAEGGTARREAFKDGFGGEAEGGTA